MSKSVDPCPYDCADHPVNAVYYFCLELIFRYGRHPIGLAVWHMRRLGELLPLAVWAFFSMYSSTLGTPTRRIPPGAFPPPGAKTVTFTSYPPLLLYGTSFYIINIIATPTRRKSFHHDRGRITFYLQFNLYPSETPPATIHSAVASGANFQHF